MGTVKKFFIPYAVRSLSQQLMSLFSVLGVFLGMPKNGKIKFGEETQEEVGEGQIASSFDDGKAVIHFPGANFVLGIIGGTDPQYKDWYEIERLEVRFSFPIKRDLFLAKLEEVVGPVTVLGSGYEYIKIKLEKIELEKLYKRARNP